jgi:hypothetical protein
VKFNPFILMIEDFVAELKAQKKTLENAVHPM